MYILDAPLTIPTKSKKDFRLNLNIYRNAHHYTLNTAKINYKEYMKEQIEKLPVFNKVSVNYILYPKTRHKQDISNILCIHDKFFMDALVEFGKLPSDNYDHVPMINYRWGEIDRNNPRVTIYTNQTPLREP